MIVKALKLGITDQNVRYVVQALNSAPFLVEIKSNEFTPGEDLVPILKHRIASILYLAPERIFELEFLNGLFL